MLPELRFLIKVLVTVAIHFCHKTHFLALASSSVSKSRTDHLLKIKNGYTFSSLSTTIKVHHYKLKNQFKFQTVA